MAPRGASGMCNTNLYKNRSEGGWTTINLVPQAIRLGAIILTQAKTPSLSCRRLDFDRPAATTGTHISYTLTMLASQTVNRHHLIQSLRRADQHAIVGLH